MNDPDGKLWTQDAAARRGLTLDARPAGYFDATAELWDAEYDHGTLRGHLWRSRLGAALALIGDGPGRLLEVGTGPGRLIAALASRGWEVTGIDASPRMVELARARLPPEVGALLVASAEDLPFDGESFDFAVGLGVFEFTEIEQSLRELVRVLRQGGTALIGLRNADAATRVWQRRVMHPPARRLKLLVPFGRPMPRPASAALSRRDAERLLRSAGLEVHRVEEVGCGVLPDPLDVFAPRLAYRAAVAAERRPRLRRRLGRQLLLVARKPP